MDIDSERLDMIHKLALCYSSELGSDLLIESTTDRRAALQDTDFVINTAAVKSHHHQADIRKIIAKHGYYHTVRENIPGSFYNFSLMLDVVHEMEEICPDAWLIQSGNPVFAGCTLMTRKSDLKIVGLCHGHYGVYEIARTIGLEINDMKDLTWQAPGLNHNIWLTHFIYQGQDAYPLIDEWIETKGEEYWATHIAERTHDVQMSKGAVHQYKLYGCFPIGDTVRSRGWWYHHNLAAKKFWFGEPFGGPDTEIARPFYVKNLDEKLGNMKRLANDPRASLVESLGAVKIKEQQVPIIDALVNNVEGEFEVNVPNNGALPGVPDNVVVEVPAIINKKGISPMHVEPLPTKIMLESIYPEWLQMERDLLAFQTGDRSQLVWNALNSAQTQSYDQAVAMLDEVMKMPGHEEVNEHFQFQNGEESMLMRQGMKG